MSLIKPVRKANSLHTLCIGLALISVLSVSSATSSWAQDTIKIATWNIEHLGSSGRGLGGIGAGNLPRRTDDQLKAIANQIKIDLKADLVSLQEVAITDIFDGIPVSESLKKITDELGDEWEYWIGNSGRTETTPDPHRNLQCAFLWNTAKVRALKIFSFSFPNEHVGNKRLFDRTPLLGYFQAIKAGVDTNDFLLINVHLTSGQHNDENHLVAMVIIQQNLNNTLKKQLIKESDRIILGDFNDNQFAKNENGTPKYTDLLYRYMEYKKYTGLVTEETGATRMDDNLQSIIDKVLVSRGAKGHLVSTQVVKYMPPDSSTAGLAQWRRTFSDHFPLGFEMKVADSDDDVD